MLDVQDLFVLGPGEGLLPDLVILGYLLLEDWAQCSRQRCPAQGMPGTQPAHTEPGHTSTFPVQSPSDPTDPWLLLPTRVTSGRSVGSLAVFPSQRLLLHFGAVGPAHPPSGLPDELVQFSGSEHSPRRTEPECHLGTGPDPSTSLPHRSLTACSGPALLVFLCHSAWAFLS